MIKINTMHKTPLELEIAQKYNIPVKYIYVGGLDQLLLSNGRMLTETTYIGYSVISARDTLPISSNELGEYLNAE